MVIVNMTVWSSVAALKDFAYRTVHAEFLARRREWFVAGSTGVVLWWIRAGELPTVDDAKRRLEFLERHGASPYAFRFARPPAPFVIERTSLEDPDTAELIARLERRADRTVRRPVRQPLPARSRRGVTGAGAVVVGRLDDRAVACGALRRIPDIDSEIDGDIDGTGLAHRGDQADVRRARGAGQQARGGDPRPSRARGRRPRDRPPRPRDGEPAAGGDPDVRARRVHGSRQVGRVRRQRRTAGASRSDSTRRRSATTGDQASGGTPSTWISPNGSTPTRRWVSHTSRGSG